MAHRTLGMESWLQKRGVNNGDRQLAGLTLELGPLRHKNEGFPLSLLLPKIGERGSVQAPGVCHGWLSWISSSSGMIRSVVGSLAPRGVGDTWTETRKKSFNVGGGRSLKAVNADADVSVPSLVHAHTLS